MKNHLFTLLFLLLSLASFSQETADGVGDHIFLPSLEVGYVVPNSEFLSGGLLIKTSIEYRINNPEGLFFRLNYDTYDTSYELQNLDNLTNVVEGTAFFSDLLFGAGYRIGLEKKFRSFIMVQPGYKFYNFPSASLENNVVQISQGRSSILTSRVTLGLEYYINPKSAVTVDLFQNQVWNKQDFWSEHTAAYGLSLGFITALY